MLEHGESPVDIDEDDYEAEGGLLWSTAAIGIAALILLVTNAVSLGDWIEDMHPSAAQEQAAEISADWRDATDQIGVGAPRALLHGWWKRAEAARFGGEAAPAGPDREPAGTKSQR